MPTGGGKSPIYGDSPEGGGGTLAAGDDNLAENGINHRRSNSNVPKH